MLNIADVLKQGCLGSEAIFGHVNIKKEKCSEELPNVLNKKTQEPAEYTKETCLSSVVDNSSTDLLKNKTEDLIISSLFNNDPVDCVIKVELDEVHNHDETSLESHDDENYTEEMENEIEHDSKTENFFVRDEYKAHLLSHHDPQNFGDFQCDLCQKKFQSQYSFKIHLRTHLLKTVRISTNTDPSKTCDGESTDKFNLTKHVDNRNCSQYTCTGCEKSFLDKESLRAHEAEHIEGAPTTKRLKFSESIQKLIVFKIENPESNSSTATVTNPEQKSEEDKGLSIYKNKRSTHKVKLESNKGKEHITDTNQMDSIKNRASTNSVEYYPAVTKYDNNISCSNGKQPTSSSNYGVLSCDMCEYITSINRINNFNSHLKAHAAKTQYSCDFCLFITSELRIINLHANLHRGMKPYFCNVCDEKFSQKGHLDEHVLLHTGEKPYSCNVCNKKFSDKSSLIRHVRLHTGKNPYFCNVCDKKYCDKSSFNKHVRLHKGVKLYSCNVCDKKYIYKSKLDRHTGLHTGEKPYSCNVCAKKFSDKSHLDVHVRLHTGEKPYSCNVCNKKFSDKSGLNKHVRLHTGKESYPCNVCNKKLSDKSSLNRHVRLHTGKESYFCNVCAKEFSDKSYFNRHVGIHTGDTTYSCNVCDKKFLVKRGLDVHVRLHTGEKPYSCNVCDKKFSQKGHLKKHVRLHTGEKPYFCNVCDKEFSDKSNLNRHVRLHTGEKPYSCNVCDKKFSDKSNFKTHVSIHTGETTY